MIMVPNGGYLTLGAKIGLMLNTIKQIFYKEVK